MNTQTQQLINLYQSTARNFLAEKQNGKITEQTRDGINMLDKVFKVLNITTTPIWESAEAYFSAQYCKL